MLNQFALSSNLYYCRLHRKPVRLTVLLYSIRRVLNSRLFPSTIGPVRAASASSSFMTRREVAAFLNVSEKWLAQSGRASGPPFYKFGNHCRYHFDDVLNWARQQRASQFVAFGSVR